MEDQDKQEQLRRDILALWEKSKTSNSLLTPEEVEKWLARLQDCIKAPTSKPPS
jgi:hypothetical protein